MADKTQKKTPKKLLPFFFEIELYVTFPFKISWFQLGKFSKVLCLTLTALFFTNLNSLNCMV